MSYPPAPSKESNYLGVRLGDLPPALGQQLSLGFCVCRCVPGMPGIVCLRCVIRAPRTQLCLAVYRKPSRLFPRMVTWSRAMWFREAVICTLVSVLGLLAL